MGSLLRQAVYAISGHRLFEGLRSRVGKIPTIKELNIAYFAYKYIATLFLQTFKVI